MKLLTGIWFTNCIQHVVDSSSGILVFSRIPEKLKRFYGNHTLFIFLLVLCGLSYGTWQLSLLYPDIGQVDGMKPGDYIVFNMAVKLFAGLGLFLYAMLNISKALNSFAGSKLIRVLELATFNPYVGFITGVVVTGILQSSSITTVMLVSLVAARAMPFRKSIPVIFGANVGSTVTGLLLTLNIEVLGLVLVIIGVTFILSKASKSYSAIGDALVMLALLFGGMLLMKNGMAPLRSYQPFHVMMESMANPLNAVLVGAGFTAIVQSSAATIGVVKALAGTGAITLSAGIVLAIGANIGTCITAALAMIGQNKLALRVVVAHLAFNVIGGLVVVLFFTTQLIWLVQYVAPEALVEDQIIYAHGLFNLIAAMCFLPFSNRISSIVERIVPVKMVRVEVFAPKFLVDEAVMNGDLGIFLALRGIQRELYRMGGLIHSMSKNASVAIISPTHEAYNKIIKAESNADVLYQAIQESIFSLLLLELSEEDGVMIKTFSTYVNEFERAANSIEDIAKAGIKGIHKGVVVSEETKILIKDVFERVNIQIENTLVLIDGRKKIKKLHKIQKQVIEAELPLVELVQGIKENLIGKRTIEIQNHDIKSLKFEEDVLNLIVRVFKKMRRTAKTDVVQHLSKID